MDIFTKALKFEDFRRLKDVTCVEKNQKNNTQKIIIFPSLCA